MALISRFGAPVGLIAALSMVSTPALAADMPQGMATQSAQGGAVFADFDTTTFDNASEISEYHRRGWRRGWRRHRRVDAGDVIAGVLIIGGIAAIADAASKNRKRDRDYDRDYERRNDRRYDRRERRNTSVRGLEGAVDQCVSRIQQDVRVDSVDGVDRTAQGWVVTGSLFNGSGFTCAIDNSGQIDTIDYGEFGRSGMQGISAPGAQDSDGQWDDDRYIAARRSAPGYQPTTYGEAQPAGSDQLPAYPGGPLPGESLPE